MKTLKFNIKKNTTSLALASLLLAAGLNSACKEDFLIKEPETSLSDAVMFTSVDKAETVITGLYSSSKSGALFGGRYQIYNDIRAEEFRNRTTNTVTGYTTYQFTNDPGDTYIANFWSQAYLTINRANIAIDGLTKNESGLDQAFVTRAIAEAKFIRALNYFGLVQIFAKPYVADNGASPGLPLRLQPEVGPDNNDMPRSTVAQVYTQILSDLDDAIAGLASDNGSREANLTRAHKNTAIALKTRVLLAKGDYPGVITEANKIVTPTAPFTTTSGVPASLNANVRAVFQAPFNTPESIFSFPMATTNAPGTQNQLGYYFNAGNLEYFLNSTAPGIYAHPQWGTNDARRTELTAVYSGIGPHPTKFSGISPYTDYVPMIRYAEVLLNLAEAEAEVGSQTRARALLEAVHHRSDPTYDFGTMNKAQLIEAILTERRIELLGEGFRFNDLARRNSPIWSYGAGATIQPSDSRYIFPIPTSETKTNTQI
jgi:hypothetical protein